MNGPRLISPLQNPESTLGAALLQFFKRFSAVLSLSLLLGAAPRLLLVFLDNIPGVYRIDLLPWLMERIQNETLLETYGEIINTYAEMGLFSISPLNLAISALVGLLLTPLLNGCMARLAISGFLGENKETVDLLAEGRSRYLRLAGTNFCVCLAALPVYAAAALPSVFAALIGGALGLLLSVVSLAVMAAASLAVICLGGMNAAVVIDEEKSGFAAVVRTWKLTKVRLLRSGLALLLASAAVNYLTLMAESLFLSAGTYVGAAAAALAGGVLYAIIPLTGARCYIAGKSRAAWSAPLPEDPVMGIEAGQEPENVEQETK